MVYKFLFLLLLIVLSGVFSASEIALVAITPAKVRELIAKKKRGARSIEKLKKHPQKLLITILIGNNVVNIVASVYATILFTEIFGSSGAGIAVGVMTFLVLVFGEITPKSFAHRYSISFSLVIAKFFLVLEKIFTPVIWLLEKLVSLFMRFTGNDSVPKSMTEDELKAMVSLGAEEGSLEKQEKELIENVLEFNDIHVEEVMTPRPEIQALDLDTTIQEAAQFISKNTHSRIPVIKDNLDNIVGILSVKEVLMQLAQNHEDKTLASIDILPVLHVPTTRKINHLFKDFQKQRMHMAIVIDEHGGTAGLVTIEDLLEEIVGEIEDEYDVEETLIEKVDAKTFLIKGKTPLMDVSKALRVHFKDIPDYKPISFLILENLHRFPRKEEQFDIESLRFTVKKMGKKTIELVQVMKK